MVFYATQVAGNLRCEREVLAEQSGKCQSRLGLSIVELKMVYFAVVNVWN